MRLAGCLVALLLTSCTADDVPAPGETSWCTLAREPLTHAPDAAAPAPNYVITTVMSPRQRSIRVAVEYGGRVGESTGPLVGADGEYCPTLSGITVTLSGQLATTFAQGGWLCVNATPLCRPPLLGFELPADYFPTEESLLVTQQGMTSTLALGDVAQARAASPVGHDTWAFQAHEVVDFQWSHAGDLVNAHPSAVLACATGPLIHIDDVAIVADLVRLTVPLTTVSGCELELTLTRESVGDHVRHTVTQTIRHPIQILVGAAS